MPRSWRYAAWSWCWLLLCFIAILILLFLSQRVCQDPGSMLPSPVDGCCFVSILYWLDYFYRSMYAKILAVCGLVLLMAVAMFQRYTDYIIFIAACMPRSWQYAAWSCWWLLLCFIAILIILFLSQRVCQDPGGMRPGPVDGCCYVSLLYWLYYFYRSVYAKILAVCGLVLLMAVTMFQCYTD